MTTFQQRRRRAAKLTQFFGVDYRELINEVLESIEVGVQSDRNNGTLRDEEVEVRWLCLSLADVWVEVSNLFTNLGLTCEAPEAEEQAPDFRLRPCFNSIHMVPIFFGRCTTSSDIPTFLTMTSFSSL